MSKTIIFSCGYARELKVGETARPVLKGQFHITEQVCQACSYIDRGLSVPNDVMKEMDVSEETLSQRHSYFNISQYDFLKELADDYDALCN